MSLVRKPMPLGALWLLLIASSGRALATELVSQDPAATNDTELGFVVFQKNCTSCHGNPAVERAPTPAQLRSMPPERILDALTKGPMKAVGDTLTDTQRRKVAASLAGRPLGTGAAADARSLPNRCRPGMPLGDPSVGPHWNGWGVDIVNSRFQPADQAGLDAESVRHLKLRWVFGLPNSSSSYSQPSVVAGRVYVGADTGYVYALDSRTGCVHWSYRAKAGVRNALVVAPLGSSAGSPNAVYFGDLLANVYALDAQTGRRIWVRNVGRHYSNRITASPAIFAGRLYVPVSSWEGIAAATAQYPCCQSVGAVVALDAATGRERWRSPVITEGPHPLGLNPAGVMRWGPAGAPVWNTPTIDVARKRVYFGTGDATTFPAPATSDAVIAVDMATGKQVWTYQVFRNDSFLVGCPTGEAITNCPAAQGPDFDIPGSVVLRRVNGKDVLFVATKPGDILALDPDHDGALLWRKNLTGPVVGETPAGSADGHQVKHSGVLWGGAYADDAAYFGLTGGGVVAIRSADGERLWFNALEGEAGRKLGNGAATTAVPGVVFIGGADGRLSAVSAVDGALLWQYATNREFDAVDKVPTRGGSIQSGGAVVVDGQVYVGSGFGVIGGLTGNAVLAFGVE